MLPAESFYLIKMNAPDRYVLPFITGLCFFLLDFFSWPGDGLLGLNTFALESRSLGGRPGLRLSLWGYYCYRRILSLYFMPISLLHTAVCKCVSSSYSSPAASGSCPHFELACFLELRGIYAAGKIIICKHSDCFIFPPASHFKFLCSTSSMLSFFDHHPPSYFH